MIEITYESALDGLKAIVSERGYDFMYEVNEDGCQYVRDGAPSCLIGCYLASVGVPLERLVRADVARVGGTSASDLMQSLVQEGVIASPTERTVTLLTMAQFGQDNNETWGEALASASNEN